jgi:hypothetical protein
VCGEVVTRHSLPFRRALAPREGFLL